MRRASGAYVQQGLETKQRLEAGQQQNLQTRDGGEKLGSQSGLSLVLDVVDRHLGLC